MKDSRVINSIILYNDDNHGSEVWVNGQIAGNTDDEVELLKNVFKMGTAVCAKPFISKKVYLCDLPEDLTEEEVDNIHSFFMRSCQITQEQEDAIFRGDYKTLLQII